MRSSLSAVCLLGLVCGVFAQSKQDSKPVADAQPRMTRAPTAKADTRAPTAKADTRTRAPLDNVKTYDCMTKEMWTDDKKKWCCEQKGMGCKQDITRAPTNKADTRMPTVKTWEPTAVKATRAPLDNVKTYDCMTKEAWTDDKKKWCCEQKGMGCKKDITRAPTDKAYTRMPTVKTWEPTAVKVTRAPLDKPIEYNCMTKEAWTEGKKRWCCAKKQLGCKKDEPTDYNCMTKEMWTDDKKKWCCAKKGMGCVKKEVVPCDEKLRAYMSKPIAAGAKVPQCDGKLWQRRQCWGSTGTCECVDPKTGEYVGPENADRTCPDMKEEPTKFDCKTREMWTDEKKEWCCKKEKVGCKKDEPADEFDCRTEEVWTEAKQKWCCAKKRLGCKKENEEDDKKFNCMTREMWTDEKKEWCCKNKKAGCDKKDDDKKDKKDKKLKKGDVCKSGGVETGRFMDRSKECPKRTVCKPVKGQVAIGGEVDHTCQRVAKWNRRMSVITKRGTTMKQAIAEAAKFKEALLRLLKLDSDDVLEVLMKFVCRIPAARAALGITDADRKSSRCTALDAATRRNLRALQQQKLDDDILAIDTELRTDAGSKDITSIAREAAKDIEDFDIDQVIETGATIGEGYVPDVNDADKDSGESKSKFSIAAIAALVGLCMASTFAVFVVQFISKRKAAAAQSPVDTDAEKTVGTPASALESSFREMETTDVASI